MTNPQGEDFPQSVMIVDDQYSSIEMLAGIVSTLPGAPRVKSFHDPLEALRYAQQRQQDLILLDQHMPGMTGLAFLRHIRAFPAYKSVPVVMVTIQEDRNLCIEALEAGATDFLHKPVDPTECKARCTNLLAARRDRQEVEQHRHDAVRDLANNIHTHRQRTTSNVKECLFWTATVIDQYANKPDAGHIVRIGHYSGLMAQAMGYDDADVMNIVAAANTHDIGTVCVPQHILRKNTLFTAGERLQMERHCVDGARLLQTLPTDIAEMAAEVAGSHHERMDGSGYPAGLSGDSIPRAARMVAVADVFDALTTHNAIRGAMSIAQAFEHLELGKGTQFDPECVDALTLRLDDLETLVPTLPRLEHA